MFRTCLGRTPAGQRECRRACAVLSRPAVEARGGLRARRTGRWAGKDRGASAVRRPGSGCHRGEPPRCRRDDCRRHGREGTPDGYTLLVNVVSDVINPLTNKQAQYNIETSFTPVALIASAPNVLVVHPSVPVASVKELIDYARAHPGELSYGSAGVGTVSHFAGAIVASSAHVQFVHVPYKGTAAAEVDLLGGRLQFMFDSMVGALANAKAGKVKALAVTSPERWQSAPELPTIAESGFPGFDMTAWFGLVAPAGTPEPIVARISEALSKGLRTTEARNRIAALGAVPGRMTPAEFGRYIHAENARWRKIFSEGSVRIDE